MALSPIAVSTDSPRLPSPDRNALARAWVRAHETVHDEVDVNLSVIDGAVPPELRGVLYRNGPGRLEMNGRPYGHLFDGDGMITRFAFDGASVRYRNRYVATREYRDELARGDIKYRNFGTNRPGGLAANLFRTHFKNVANTSVVHHAGRLLALWEAGLPHRIDPDTLETRARYDFDGRLLDRSLRGRFLGAELPFSAHPKICLRTGELFNFGTVMGAKPELLLQRVSVDGVMAPLRRVPLEALAFVHDFVLTEHYLVFLLCPVEFDVMRMIAGLRTPVESLAFVKNKPGTFLLVPRNGAPVQRIVTPACFLFHWANGFEIDGGHLALDGLATERYPSFPDLHDAVRAARCEPTRPTLTRFEIDTTTRRVTQRSLCAHPCELPSVHPAHMGRAHRYVWGAAAPSESDQTFFTSIVKVDVQTGASVLRDFEPGLTGEPVFVPRAGAESEDDGFVLATLYVPEIHRTDLLVLDAATLVTRARLRLPHHVPPGFHGTFVS